MRINALRKELAALLAEVPANRPPALRRSLDEQWIYATDLPAARGEAGCADFFRKLEKAGWEYTEDSGWILMRKAAKEPPEGWYEGAFGPEAGCCLSLLERHAKAAEGSPEEAQRALIRAGEEGDKAYEAVCAKLHRDWADRLRRKEPLPVLSPRYFGK